eukprot:TRINITY_DN22702_c0_g1_i4.p1 TRINITY_DN22702_c0_g1~~TRINITY_DN22702_c0_g1_i4.p1  ORF type:complete len:133 (-),score=20.71 TRINITY_DN22702_c0_g1_i4:213-611(-)
MNYSPFRTRTVVKSAISKTILDNEKPPLVMARFRTTQIKKKARLEKIININSSISTMSVYHSQILGSSCATSIDSRAARGQLQGRKTWIEGSGQLTNCEKTTNKICKVNRGQVPSSSLSSQKPRLFPKERKK